MKRIALLLIIFIPSVAFPQLDTEKALHQQILINLSKDLKEHYYDPNLHGVDLDASIRQARQLIASAKSVGEMTDIVARVLIPFDDSHLGFSPPATTVSIDYGFEMRLYGDKVFVNKVVDDSKAYKKGVRPGDQVYMFEGFIPTRKEFRLLRHHYYVFAPQPKVTLLVIKPDGNKYKVEIEAKLTQESVFRPTTRDLNLQYEKEFLDRTHQGFYDDIPGLSIWKIPTFEFSDIKVAKMIERAKKSDALILDLRGNSGGYVYSLQDLINGLFEKDVTVGEFHSRKKTETEGVKGGGKNAYSGKLVVLVDSDSASASEIFARIVQLEGRGKVIGDQSSGQVMQAITYVHYFGIDVRTGYAFSITDADIIMKDGQRLEKVGVTPDVRVIPSPLDLAKGRDPVLARAAEQLGFKLSPEDAGKIFEKKK